MKKTAVKTKSEPAAATAPATEAAATPQPGEFKIVPRDRVRPDPDQPRKEFDPEALEELAWSIYHHGIQQPLVVQLRHGLKIKEPDMLQPDWQAVDAAGAVVFSGSEQAVREFAEGKTEDFYQIIFGERRHRASGPQTFERDGEKIKWPGLSQVPVIVRECTEKDRFVLQFIENNHRVNLSALEEARAFDRRLTERRASEPDYNVEKLVADLGIKRSTVYNRLKMLRLHEPVRQALVAGKIETSVAGAIAEVPDLKKQEEVLHRVLEREDWGEVMSFRAVKELIYDEYAKQLKGAPFDKEDAALVPSTWKITAGENELVIECAKRPQIHQSPLSIGVPKVVPGAGFKPQEYGMFFVTDHSNFEMLGPVPKKLAKQVAEFLVANAEASTIHVSQASGWPCTTCPHRSGVIDPDSKNPNVCLLPTCFDGKVKAHWIKKAADMRQKGTPVLTQGEFRKQKDKYVASDSKNTNAQDHYWQTWDEILGKQKPEPTLVATPEGIQKFYLKDEAVAAARKKGIKFYRDAAAEKPQTPEDKAKAAAKEKEREQATELREQLVKDLAPDLVKGIAAMKDKDAWMFAGRILEGEAYSKWTGDLEDVFAKVKDPKTKVIGTLLASGELYPVAGDGDWNENAVAFWKAAGVDLLAEEKKRAADKTKELALPLKKADPQQKELLTVGKSRAPKKRKGKK